MVKYRRLNEVVTKTKFLCLQTKYKGCLPLLTFMWREAVNAFVIHSKNVAVFDWLQSPGPPVLYNQLVLYTIDQPRFKMR